MLTRVMSFFGRNVIYLPWQQSCNLVARAGLNSNFTCQADDILDYMRMILVERDFFR